MTPAPPYNLGINGIRIQHSYAYYTNTALGLFVRMPIYQNGAADVLVAGHSGDDFAFDRAGNAYVTQDPANTLYKVTPSGNVSTILGGADDPLIEGDTAQFGRTPVDQHILYLVTNGGLLKPVDGPAVGGKVVSFNTDCQ
jgi:hypothetical protein